MTTLTVGCECGWCTDLELTSETNPTRCPQCGGAIMLTAMGELSDQPLYVTGQYNPCLYGDRWYSGDRTEYRAFWIAEHEQYVVDGPQWYSADGDNWYEQPGVPAHGENFERARISLVGGPRHGTAVAEEHDMIDRIKAYWDERTTPPGWSWEEWSGDRILDSGGEDADCYDTADQAVTIVIERAAAYGIDLQGGDVAHHPTEDGGWAEWRRPGA